MVYTKYGLSREDCEANFQKFAEVSMFLFVTTFAKYFAKYFSF